MPTVSKSRPGIPLQLMLASGVILAMLVLASALAFQAYRGIERVMISAAGDSAEQLGTTINERVRRLLEPASSTINLLAFDQLADVDNLPQRLERLPVLVNVLNSLPVLSAVYVGYPNGEFLLLRRFVTKQEQQALSAPADTAYLVQTITLGSEGVFLGEWRFYDANLHLRQSQVKQDYRYDPRTRPWYQKASQSHETVLTAPYVFFTTRQIGLTMARRSVSGGAIFGVDAAVSDLSTEMSELKLTEHTEMAITTPQGDVLAYPDVNRLLVPQERGYRVATLSELAVPPLTRVFDSRAGVAEAESFSSGGQSWYGFWLPLISLKDNNAKILLAIPANELLREARQIIFDQAWIALLVVLGSLPFGWMLAQRIGRPLRDLSEQVQALVAFDFRQTLQVRSQVREVEELSQLIGSMSVTIDNFLNMTLNLNRETHLESMLSQVLLRMVDAIGLQGGAVYLTEEDSPLLRLAAQVRFASAPGELRLHVTQQDVNREQMLTSTVENALGSVELLHTVVLQNREAELLGVMVLKLAPDTLRSSAEHRAFARFVEELSGAAAIAIETRQLIEAQARLLDAIIKLLADAIDAKSPYTSGHCERVPQLAQMLLDQVKAQQAGPYADFTMSEKEEYEFRIAAWLHDCGKITSPEYVVDKATKLETLYNRIHEVRTRFEVLWRDAELDYWKGIAAGGDRAELGRQMHLKQQQLQEDFAFIAACNVGGESMSDDDLERIRQIAEQTWLRHFDNRLGISHDEAERLEPVPPVELPAPEKLLDDRPEHIIHWGERKPPVVADDPRNHWGFDMKLPQHAYNMGEVYNLSVHRGTLTEEERFKINEHIVQTIIMLNALPLPKFLSRVPDIAGNHHEKMDGTGYPRHLQANDMSIPERVMAIADIFEALTAADRPYKEPKTLSESVAIMSVMAREGHIDPQLFKLFLRTNVYRDYGRRFLLASQMDEVDVASVIQALGG